MSAVPPVKVSVVVTLTAAEEGTGGVIGTLASLVAQDYPLDQVEILISQYGLDPAAEAEIKHRFPNAEISGAPLDGYYALKNHGFERARGEIIALADADCVYSPQWLRELVHAIDAGADVAAGLTHLEGGSLLHRLCGFYDQHQALLRTSAKTRRFVSNNVAFRAELVKDCGYDPRFDRTGGCVQLAEKLLRRGAELRFTPEQAGLHHYYGFARHTWKQAICSGYDFFHSREVDPEMPLARLTRLPVLGPPLLSGIFVAADALNIAQNRRVLGIRWYELPVFLAFSLIVRPIEMVGMLWFRFHPASAARFVARNFA